MRKWFVLAAVLVGVVAVILAAWIRLPTLMEIGPGYSAEVSCACVFVSGRTPESCAGDLDSLSRRFVAVSVDPVSRSATATTLGLVRRTARYREGYGCTLEN